MKYTIVKLRGTGENIDAPNNFLTQFSNALINTSPEHFTDGGDIPFFASIGPMNPEKSFLGASLKASRESGKLHLLQYLRENEGPFIILGYSLGAIVVTVTIEELVEVGDWYTLHKIGAVANFANPLRNEGDSFFEFDVPGYGIAGQHAPFPEGLLYYEMANRFDGITCCAYDSPLRNLPDVGDAFSFAITGGWSQDLIDRLYQQRWQLMSWQWWKNPRRIAVRHVEAIGLLHGYLYTGQHTLVYQQGLYFDVLIKELVHKLV